MQAPAAAERNKGPILAVLREYAGPGAHAEPGGLRVSTPGRCAGFGSACSGCWWGGCAGRAGNAPAGVDVEFGACSIAAYTEAMRVPNVLPPILLDVSQGWETWGGTQPATLDLLVSINMMHIAELRCTEGLFKGAGVLLKPGGVLFTYG
ncbi:MTL26 protein, partial [Thalassarche chlororhynchos]|nr:MTL26 protein [Thalassarche chlororhynchos]